MIHPIPPQNPKSNQDCCSGILKVEPHKDGNEIFDQESDVILSLLGAIEKDDSVDKAINRYKPENLSKEEKMEFWSSMIQKKPIIVLGSLDKFKNEPFAQELVRKIASLSPSDSWSILVGSKD